MINKAALIAGALGMLKSAAFFTLSFWAPLLAVSLLPIWPHDFSWAAAFAFVGLCLASLVVWNLALSYTGFFRWALYRVWRPGRRPCLCDVQRAYCFRHRSSPREPNRPGIVAAKLRGDS